MTWSSFHRRGDVLRAVVAAAEARRDGVLPLDVDGVVDVFDGERDLLGALLLSWNTRLTGRIERRQMGQPSSLEQAVVGAWHDTYAQLGGVRRVLDAARDSESPEVRETMARASTKEQQNLAVAAGLGSAPDRASARVGARLEQRARETFVAVGHDTDLATWGTSPGVWDRVLGRLRALAA